MVLMLKVLVKSETDGKEWKESYELPENAVGREQEYAELIIKEWNEEETRRVSITKRLKNKYYADYRKIIKIISVSENGIAYCRPQKKNLHSKMVGRGTYQIYDIMVCVFCGFKQRRIGVHDMARKECHPEKTCKDCGIKLKTVEKYNDHRVRIHKDASMIQIINNVKKENES